jgi:glutaredoxin 3
VKKKKRKPRVIVFTAPSCPWCNRVKQYLRKNDITFKNIDISKNAHAARDIKRKTGQMGVPVTLINNRPVVGFNKQMLNRLLGIK